MLRDVFGNPFLFGDRLIRHNVIDVGIFLLGALHPPTGSFALTIRAAIAAEYCPALVARSWMSAASWIRLLKRYLNFDRSRVYAVPTHAPNVAICGQP